MGCWRTALVVLAFSLSLALYLQHVSAAACQGTSTSCTGLAQSPCTSQDGCGWGYSSCGCASSSNCFTYYYSLQYASCSQAYIITNYECSSCGCTYDYGGGGGIGRGSSCYGNAYCYSLSQANCNTCPVCAPVYACQGTATQCGSYVSYSECTSQSGCSWNPCYYTGSGDWVLDVSDNCVISEDFAVNGKLIITGSGGTVTFNQVEVSADSLDIEATSFKVIFNKPFKFTVS